MSAWAWVLVWVLLLVGSAGYLAMRGWTLWGQVRELLAELGIAAQRLEGVQGQVLLPEDQIREPGQLAVFAPPAVLSEERPATGRSLRRRNPGRRATPGPARAGDVH